MTFLEAPAPFSVAHRRFGKFKAGRRIELLQKSGGLGRRPNVDSLPIHLARLRMYRPLRSGQANSQGISRGALSSYRQADLGNRPRSMLIDLVSRAVREDLFLAPIRHVAKRLALDKRLERLIVAPLADDQIGAVVGHVFEQLGIGMA